MREFEDYDNEQLDSRLDDLNEQLDIATTIRDGESNSIIRATYDTAVSKIERNIVEVQIEIDRRAYQVESSSIDDDDDNGKTITIKSPSGLKVEVPSIKFVR